MKRRNFLRALIAAPAISLISRTAWAEHYPAKLCGNCGFGSKKDDCAKCGKWTGSTKIPARLCGDHGFGSKKDNCVRCGKWVGSTNQPAYLCGNCGFGSKKDNCVICGKWAS
jgi:ribosomal protein L37E